MSYTLYNKLKQIELKHPKIGTWYTEDIQEAKEMLSACQEYLNASNLISLIPHICILEVETGKLLPQN